MDKSIRVRGKVYEEFQEEKLKFYQTNVNMGGHSIYIINHVVWLLLDIRVVQIEVGSRSYSYIFSECHIEGLGKGKI